MLDLFDHIYSDDIDGIKNYVRSRLHEIAAARLEEYRDFISENLFYAESSTELNEAHKYPKVIRRIGRINFVRLRVRHGKVQRNRRVSAVRGYTYRRGHLIRMRPSERLHRRLAARRAKIKRRAKRSQIRRHLLITMRKRRALGLSYRPFGR